MQPINNKNPLHQQQYNMNPNIHSMNNNSFKEYICAQEPKHPKAQPAFDEQWQSILWQPQLHTQYYRY